MSENKVAVVAGVGPGLGAALVRAFHADGYHVAGMARSTDTTGPLAEELGDAAKAVECDVTDVDSVDAAFTTVEKELGAPSVAVFNPGAGFINNFLSTPPAQFEKVWRVNVLGAVHFAQRAIPTLLKNNGTLLMTGATASVRGSARFGAFASAKHGLRALAQSLAREFGPQGVHVAHVIIDGVIINERTKSLMNISDEKGMQPDAIAASYVALAKQDKSAWAFEMDLRPSIEKW